MNTISRTEVTLVKFGGSIITDKSKPMTPRAEAIASLAKQVAELLSQEPKRHLILGTGAGSYGHYQVIRHGLRDGMRTRKQRMGFAAAQSAVAALNRLVVEELIRCDVPAVSVAPSAISVAGYGKKFFSASLIEMVRQGLVPVVYGDIIVHPERGCVVYSTETVFDEIITSMESEGARVRAVVHLGTAPGVYDATGKVIPLITRSNWETVQRHLHHTEGYDVTGGMRHKVEQGLRYAEKKIVVAIVGGEGKSALFDALSGKSGTRIM